MGIHQTCMDISLWQAFDMFNVWWPWPQFQGHFLLVEYLSNQCMDFLRTCKDISLWQAEELIRFWWPWPNFQGHSIVSGMSFEAVYGFSPNLHSYIIVTSLWPRSHFQGNNLVSCISSEPVDGFSPKLHRYIIVTSFRADCILVTMTSTRS